MGTKPNTVGGQVYQCYSVSRPAPATVTPSYSHVDLLESKSITFTPAASSCQMDSTNIYTESDHSSAVGTTYSEISESGNTITMDTTSATMKQGIYPIYSKTSTADPLAPIMWTPAIFSYVDSTKTSTAGAPFAKPCTAKLFPSVLGKTSAVEETHLNDIAVDFTTELRALCGTTFEYTSNTAKGDAFVGIMDNLGDMTWAISFKSLAPSVPEDS